MSDRHHDVTQATDFLHTITPFQSLTAEALYKLASGLEAAYYCNGKTICSSPGSTGLVIIRKGAVRLLDDAGRFLDQRSEGEFFGHPIHFHGELKDYVAVAEEDCLLWHLSGQALSDLRSDNPSLAGFFDSSPQERLSAASQSEDSLTGLSDLSKREPTCRSANRYRWIQRPVFVRQRS
jgi:signal-transduction protein with cAMP-binding, CBS, and nucleotidyltransferase domain